MLRILEAHVYEGPDSMRCNFPGIRTVGLILLTGMLLHACGPRSTPSAPPGAQESRPENTNAQIPAPAEVAPAPLHTPPPAVLTEAHLARVRTGMSPDEVRAILGDEHAVVGGDGGAVQVLRWEDSEGNYCTVRFDNDALRTRTGLQRRRSIASTAAQNPVPVPEAIDGRPVAQIAPGVYIPLERAVEASTGQPRGAIRLPETEPTPPSRAPIRWSAPEPAEERNGPTMVVAGGQKKDGAAEARSYRPRARLPQVSRSLREGRYEIRLINPSDSPLQVGLRQDKLGQDLTVPPKGQASALVDRGVYGLFFIREDAPYTLYEANPITIDGFRASDVEVHLNIDDVEVRLIDYSQPE